MASKKPKKPSSNSNTYTYTVNGKTITAPKADASVTAAAQKAADSYGGGSKNPPPAPTKPSGGGSSGSSSSGSKSSSGSSSGLLNTPTTNKNLSIGGVTFGSQSEYDKFLKDNANNPYIQADLKKTSGGSSSSSTPTSMGVTSPAPTSGTYTGNSIVDFLGSQGKASDFNSRSKLAAQYGISNYTGSAAQNTQLLNEMRKTSNSLPNQTTIPEVPKSSVEIKNYQGQDYLVTGDPIKDANALKEAMQAAKDAKKAEQRAAQIQAESQSQAPDISNQGLLLQLAELRKNLEKDIQPKVNDLSYLRSRNAQQIANTLASAGDESLQTGRAGIYQQTAAQQEAVKQAEIENLIAGANSQALMLGTGIGATMPVSVTPGNALVSPQSGSEIYSGMGGLQGYQNFLYNQKTGQDLGYQATQVANTIQQADANFNLLLQQAGINPTQVAGANDIIRRVTNFLGGNQGATATFDATLNSSIGKLLASGVFTGDESKNILDSARSKTGAGLTELYLNLKNIAINKYNTYVAQSQQYAGAGTGNVPLSLKPMENIQGAGGIPGGTGTGSNNDPLGIL